MRIYFERNRKDSILFALMLLPGILLFYLTRFPMWVLLLYAGGCLLSATIRICPAERLSYMWTILTLGIASAISIYTMQHIILTGDFYSRTSSEILFLNMLCAGILYFLVFVISCSPRITFFIVHTGLTILAMVDFFVYSFRQNEFSFADVKAFGTGLSVSGGYPLFLNQKIAYAVMMSIVMYVFAWRFKITYQRKWLARICGGVLCAAVTIFIGIRTSGINTQTWTLKGTYQNGYLLNFWTGMRDTLFIKKPAGYSIKQIEKLEKTYGTESENTSGGESGTDTTSTGTAGTVQGKEPTVIVIMNESFADLTTIGNFTTNEEVTPFLNSLKKNTMKGYALSSVFGAKTPNSEWEFLTGNSMAFLPEGSVVYQQFINRKPYSLVSTLKEEGYTAVGMHPYYDTGWSRNSVYPRLGFDETYFMDDFDQTNLMRRYITDQEMYDKMIERFQTKQDGEKLFLFGVTMQNHGGYSQMYPNFTETIYPNNAYYFDVRQYLTLIRHSDEALKNLITYFQSVDESVEIVFFGDHQPSLNEGFYKKLNGKGLSGLTMDELENLYKVPYFIWTNYETEAVESETISLNYLSSFALERGGFTLPSYSRFLLDMQKQIPAINSRGYYSKSKGGFVHLSDATGDEKDWIKKYRMLQYNSMFDKKHRSDLFFPYFSNEDEGDS